MILLHWQTHKSLTTCIYCNDACDSFFNNGSCVCTYCLYDNGYKYKWCGGFTYSKTVCVCDLGPLYSKLFEFIQKVYDKALGRPWNPKERAQVDLAYEVLRIPEGSVMPWTLSGAGDASEPKDQCADCEVTAMGIKHVTGCSYEEHS